MSKLIDFYNDEFSLDGDLFSEIVFSWNDEKWEFHHDFIQWLFPLKTPSNFNPDAPLLTHEDMSEFEEDKVLQNNLRAAFRRFCKFIGLRTTLTHGNAGNVDFFLGDKIEGSYSLQKNPTQWEQKKKIWEHVNHNWLRITRVLASLRLLKEDQEADLFFDILSELYNEGYGSPESFDYWVKACQGKIF